MKCVMIWFFYSIVQHYIVDCRKRMKFLFQTIQNDIIVNEHFDGHFVIHCRFRFRCLDFENKQYL
jgi:hypothetical protein